MEIGVDTVAQNMKEENVLVKSVLVASLTLSKEKKTASSNLFKAMASLCSTYGLDYI